MQAIFWSQKIYTDLLVQQETQAHGQNIAQCHSPTSRLCGRLAYVPRSLGNGEKARLDNDEEEG